MRSNENPTDPLAVLVVEDEPLIREMTVDALKQAGFEAVGVAAAEDALGLAMMEVRFDALFTDIQLAGVLNGWELAADLREAWPEMPIICTSGHDFDRDALARVPGAVFVPKPYRVDRIGAMLTQLLAEADRKRFDPTGKPRVEWALSA